MTKLIFHAPTANALTRARKHIDNVLKATSDCSIELVVNAEATAYAIKHPAPTDNYLRVCKNSLTAQKLVAPANLQIVDVAVLHIAQRQAEGWAYVRA